MNFFEHQDQAKRQSRRLYFVFALAVIAIVLMVNILVAFGAAYFGATQSNLAQFNLFSGEWLQQNTGLMLASTFITSGASGTCIMFGIAAILGILLLEIVLAHV